MFYFLCAIIKHTCQNSNSFDFDKKQSKTKQKPVGDIVFIIFRDIFYGFFVCPSSREIIYISEYFDDQGRKIKDLKWSFGEPTDDVKYIRLNTDVYRLEATPGTTDRGFICQRGKL